MHEKVIEANAFYAAHLNEPLPGGTCPCNAEPVLVPVRQTG